MTYSHLGEGALFVSRVQASDLFGVLFRQAGLITGIFAFFVLATLSVASVLRPVYSATALVVVEPAESLLSERESGLEPGEAPDGALIDGAVEIMRSEPVLMRALELAGPIEPADILWGLDLRPDFLVFFRAEPPALLPGPEGQRALLKALRNGLSIVRRGLSPVIAITAEAATADLAARLANAVVKAHIEIQVEAKTDEARAAHALVAAQLRDVTRAGLASAPAPASADGLTDRRQEGHAVLRQRLALLEAEIALQRPDVRLVAAASPPADAGSPDVRTAVGVAALLGLTLGVAVAYTIDNLSPGMRSAAELAEAVGVPFAVAIPRLRRPRTDGQSHADAVIKEPLSPFSESMRTLQVGLQSALGPSATGQVVAVTSASGGEGKTTTALGLSRAIAASGRRVLLIDADMRSGALNRHINLPLGSGFEAILTGAADLAQIGSLVRRDPLSNVFVLANSGNSTTPPDVLFGGAAFDRLLRAARSTFDVIVLDMAAATCPADLAHVLPRADAAVVLACWGRTARGEVKEVLALIRQANPVPMPVVPALSLQPASFSRPVSRYEPAYTIG